MVVVPVTKGVKLAAQLAVPNVDVGTKLQAVGLNDPRILAMKITLPVGAVERLPMFETVAVQGEA